MTFEQLECFLTVERYMSFSIAAEELGVSQSTLSKQIKTLESELSVKLFNRNTRNVSLSDPGMEFSFYASKLLSHYKKMRNAMNSIDEDKRRGTLRITSIPVLSQYGLTSIIMDFKQMNPDLLVDIFEMDPRLALEALEKGDTDLTIMRTHKENDDKFQIFPLIDDELVMITGKNHHFAREGTISLSEAENEKFLFLGDNTGWHDICIDECIKAGFVPRVENYDLRVGTIKNMVANGAGISLLTYRVAKYIDAPDISIVSLKEKPVTILSIVAVRNAIDSISMKFITFCIERLNPIK